MSILPLFLKLKYSRTKHHSLDLSRELYCLVILVLLPTLAFSNIPTKVETAFRKLYPKTINPAWSMKSNYYVADFMNDGFDKNVWFDVNGNWVMTQTDLQTMDEVPTAVYNNFSFGQYFNSPVNNVMLAEFPKCPSVIVIKVGEYNMDIYYYLFYSLQGNLISSYNSDYFDGTLWPHFFDCH